MAHLLKVSDTEIRRLEAEQASRFETVEWRGHEYAP